MQLRAFLWQQLAGTHCSVVETRDVEPHRGLHAPSGVAGDASFWYKQSEADDYLEAWVPNGGGRQ